MSSLAFLVTELQSLASETRRKHPEVREAAEKSLAILRSSPDQSTSSLARDGPQAEDLLRPVFMGCATKNAKVVGIALGSLQRLIALRAVPASSVPVIVTTMSECVTGGVDAQLRILQTLLSLVTNFGELHGKVLGAALLLCFKLHESRIAVVSSTAAATLRQLVMFVVDKVVEEDKRLVASASDTSTGVPTSVVKLPDGSSASLGPAAQDAFAVFQDLCFLANGEKPLYLQLDSLPKTFALELVESVVTNYHELFRQHRELILVLRHHLSPLLLKLLSDRPSFPLMLRATRVVFLLLKQFSRQLDTEAEVFFMLLVRIVGGESDPAGGSGAQGGQPHSQTPQYHRPAWMRVLAMEIMRGLCTDAELMRLVWDAHDAHPDGSSVFTSLIAALNRLVTERPALLGVSQAMLGVGVAGPSGTTGDTGGAASTGGGVGAMAGMMANAATATVSGVVGMIASGPGLSAQSSTMKLQCIDQLDKADAPPIPESYVYMLGVQCLVAICDGFATFAAPLYTALAVQRPRTSSNVAQSGTASAASESAVRAPPALDVTKLSPEDPSAKGLTTVRSMVDSAWPAFLAALSFIISTNLSDDLFGDVLGAYQSLARVAGMLGLSTPRDALLVGLAKCAVPGKVVASVDAYVEPSTPRTATGLGNLVSGPAQAPGLSERNLACLKALVSSAAFLAGSLGDGWFEVLEAIQNADYVLTLKGTRGSGKIGASAMSSRKPSVGTVNTASGQQNAAKHPLLVDADAESVLNTIQRLFDTTKNMDDAAFRAFVDALCKLSLAMVGMQSGSSPIISASPSMDELATPASTLLGPSPLSSRRRVSGIHLPHTLRSGDFAITKLGGVALLNVQRLVHVSPEIAWDPIISHLLSVICSPLSPQTIRVQAAQVLDDVLLVLPRHFPSAENHKAEVQQRMLNSLAQQTIPDTVWREGTATRVELRKVGLETLHEILQAAGPTLLVGWETIFDMLGSACKPPPMSRLSVGDISVASTSVPPSPDAIRRPAPLGLTGERGYAALVKVAFKSLKLVCDSLSLLNADQLRLCITTIGHFGRQSDTNIALTAAESLLWSVSDSIQLRRREAAQEDQAEDDSLNSLWMFLLLEMLGLCTDPRPAVRIGAIQTLFRTLELYGASLSLETWEECIWKITFPLLESLAASSSQVHASELSPAEDVPPMEQAWDDSKVLAYQSIGTMFAHFLASKILRLQDFDKAWDVFLAHVQEAVLVDNRSVSAPALRCLDSALQAAKDVKEPPLQERRSYVSSRAWMACEYIGEVIIRDGSNRSPAASPGEGPLMPYSQESLVAFVDVLRSARKNDEAVADEEWPLDKLSSLLAILKGVLAYPKSPDFRPDVDNLSPLQVVVMSAVYEVKRGEAGVPSLVLQHLAHCVTLPFLAAFDVGNTMPSRSGFATPMPSNTARKRVTYVAVAKAAIPQIVAIYNQHTGDGVIYQDGTLEAIFSAFSIPMKLKYDCPPASKFGKDPPLWKTATTNFLKVVKQATAQLQRIEPDLADEKLETIWRQIVDVYRGGLLADCSIIEELDLSAQQEEENFDRSLIESLKTDVVPHFGNSRIPPSLVEHLAKILQEASRMYDFTLSRAQATMDEQSPDRLEAGDQRDYAHGTVYAGKTFPRERFAYWTLDLLFALCSAVPTDDEATARRIAALSLPSLLTRCRSTLVGFVADGSLRGSLPFPRAREEEVLRILDKLLQLRLWSGSLWAAMSDSPAESCMTQPAIDVSLPSAALIADAVRRSTKAHLFELYPVLCEIATSSRTAIAWIASEAGKEAIELDARTLASQCLAEIGKEMGMAR